LGAYAFLWLVLIGRDAALDPRHTCACVARGDPGLMTWMLQW
jgi:hypothetical protein